MDGLTSKHRIALSEALVSVPAPVWRLRSCVNSSLIAEWIMSRKSSLPKTGQYSQTCASTRHN